MNILMHFITNVEHEVEYVKLCYRANYNMLGGSVCWGQSAVASGHARQNSC